MKTEKILCPDSTLPAAPILAAGIQLSALIFPLFAFSCANFSDVSLTSNVYGRPGLSGGGEICYLAV
jgi:hypothetical protein